MSGFLTHVVRCFFRQVAWEGHEPGSLRVLISPRWEKRLLGFLEATGVGRVVENREDGGTSSRQARRLDGARSGGGGLGGFRLTHSCSTFTLSFYPILQFVKGRHMYSELSVQHIASVEGFPCISFRLFGLHGEVRSAAEWRI